MDVNSVSPSPMSPAEFHTEVGVRMLDTALETAKEQGEAAIAAIPEPPRVDPAATVGRNINVYA